MARAHFVTYLLDAQGNIIAGATVNVYEPDTETLISEQLYAEDDTSGSTTKTNPFTADADGKCEIWLENPKIVDLKVTKTGYDPLTLRAAAHQLTSSTQTVKEAGTPLAQRSGLNFLDGFDLADDAGNDETEIAIDLTELTVFTDHSARHESGGADEISIADLAGIPTELQTHLDDATDAHDASAVSVDSTNLSGTGTTVQASLEELDNLLDDHSARHENGGADEISLAGLSGTPADLQTHLDDSSDAHNASAISIADAAGDFAATDVEGALAELQSEAEADNAGFLAHVADPDEHHAQAHGAADHTDRTRRIFYTPDAMGGSGAGVAEAGTGSIPNRIRYRPFNAAETGHVLMTFLLPQDATANGTLSLYIYWAPNSTNAGNVVWDAYASDGLAEGDDVFEAATADTVTDAAGGVADDLVVSVITLSTVNVSDAGQLIRLTLERDTANGADTFTGEARVLGVALEYTADS